MKKIISAILLSGLLVMGMGRTAVPQVHLEG